MTRIQRLLGSGMRCATAVVAVALLAVGARADLSRPDSIVYGRVSLNGQPVTSGVVSARNGDVVLDSFSLGSDGSAPNRFGLAIGISQQTEGIGGAVDAAVADGASARLFLEDRLLTSFVVRSGAIARLDINGGQSQCNGGANDGDLCASDDDCPGGFCVASRAICDGGGDDGQSCECIGGSCSMAVACSSNGSMGTCAGGAAAGGCCDMAMNCADGAACGGTQRVCAGGANKGLPCLRAAHCPGSQCVSTGLLCNGGSAAGYACVDDDTCPGGTCGARVATATPTPTRTSTPTRTINVAASPTPSPTATQDAPACAGDCDNSGAVSIAELIRMVNVALGSINVSNCTNGDTNEDGRITIGELIAAVGRALDGCALP